MKPVFFSLLVTLMVILLCAGCNDMHDQPSFKAQESPRLSAPRAAVTTRGEIPPPDYGSKLENPVAPDAASLKRGAELYQINCAMCHGTRDTYLGPVGRKLVPPPPSLHDPRIRQLSESDVFLRIYLGFGRMPAQGSRISDTDLWHLVNYVKSFK
jgi:mono/diheme cytochrome c family protein